MSLLGGNGGEWGSNRAGEGQVSELGRDSSLLLRTFVPVRIPLGSLYDDGGIEQGKGRKGHCFPRFENVTVKSDVDAVC